MFHRPPPRTLDAEDRRYLAWLSLSASVVLATVGWALNQELVPPTVLDEVPERILRIIMMPERPRQATPPSSFPHTVASRPPSPRLDNDAIRALVQDLRPADNAHAEDLLDIQRWNFEGSEEPTLRPLDEPLPTPDDGVGSVGGAPLPDLVVGPVETMESAEVRITPVQARLTLAARPGPTRLDPRPERLDSATVRGLLRAWRMDLDRCVAVTQRLHPGTNERYELELEAMGDGRVAATVRGDGDARDTLHRCLATRSRRWVLPDGARGRAVAPLVVVAP